jgi:hypothetical protein
MRAVHHPAPAPGPAPAGRRERPLPPLTHHEIFQLVPAFTRRGLQLDLQSSDRAARVLAFRPRLHTGVSGLDGATLPPLQETLSLTAGVDGQHTLTRRLSAADGVIDPCVAGQAGPAAAGRASSPGPEGLFATLELEGDDLGALLTRVEAVPPQRHFHRGTGFLAAHSLRAAPRGVAGGPLEQPGDGLFLCRGEVRLDAAPSLRLVLRPPRVRGPSVDVELTCPEGQRPALPDDLLAVLGRGWSPLVRWRQGWRGTLRVRGSAAQRQARAGQWLHRAGAHLAQTLAEPPSRYHLRHRRARWAVVGWRALPLALGVAVCVTAWQVQVRDIASESALKVIANIAPPLMLLTFFAMPELPRVEIPPLPRARRAGSWWDSSPAAAPPQPRP